MTWVVASIVTVIEQIEGTQTEFPIEEEFYLFDVKNKEELDVRIKEKMALINSSGESGIQYYGHKSKKYCLGVRKVSMVSSLEEELLGRNDNNPVDGAELCNNYMTVESLNDAKELAEGKAVHVHYIDDDPMDDEQ